MTPLAVAALLVFAVFITGLIRYRKRMATAFNAIQAEITIGSMELVRENPFCKQLRNEIVRVIRVAAGGNEAEESCVERFNSLDRFMQLNIVANALWNLGHGPLLANRRDPWGWYKIGNPLTLPSPDHRLIQKICDLARKEQQTTIQLLTKPLRIIGDYVFSMDRFRIEDHPQAEPIPSGVIAGTQLLLETMQRASHFITTRQYQAGLLEVLARIASPGYENASPSTKRDFLRLREQLRYLLAREAKTGSTFEPPQDVVEALIRRRESTHGISVDTTSRQYWRNSPEFSILTMVGRATDARPVNAQAVDAETIERSLREASDEPNIPSEHIRYVVTYAKTMFFIST